MGGFQTARMREQKALAKAHRMAEAFARHRTKNFLKNFLLKTDLAETIRLTAIECKDQNKEVTKQEIQEFLETDPQVDLHFGMAIALAYAMGYSDHVRGATLKQLYVPTPLADSAKGKDTPEESKIILTDEDKSKQLIGVD